MSGKGGIPSLLELLRSFDRNNCSAIFVYPLVHSDWVRYNAEIKNVEFMYYKDVSSAFRSPPLSEGFKNQFFVKFPHSRRVLTSLGIFFDALACVVAVVKVRLNKKIDLVYSCTESALPKAWIISKVLRVPLVQRGYGLGILSNDFVAGRESGSLIGYYLKIFKADLYIVVKDGDMSEVYYLANGIPKERIFLLRNGYDEKFFDYHRVCIREYLRGSGLVLGTSSRHAPEKRLDRLIKAIPNLIRAGLNVQLKLAGAGPLTPDLVRLVEKLHLERYVFFLGTLSRDDLLGFYESIDIYIQLNEYSNFGNSLIEAVGAGCTVVTTLMDSETSDIFSKHEVYPVSDPDSPDELCSVVLQICADRLQLREKAKAAFRVVTEKLLPWPERCNEEMQLLLRAIGQTRFLDS